MAGQTIADRLIAHLIADYGDVTRRHAQLHLRIHSAHVVVEESGNLLIDLEFFFAMIRVFMEWFGNFGWNFGVARKVERKSLCRKVGENLKTGVFIEKSAAKSEKQFSLKIFLRNRK